MKNRTKTSRASLKKALLLTDSNFKKEVLEAKIPVIVDFWASWCPPCKMVEPVIEELAQKYDEHLRVAKMNVDHNPKAAEQCRVQGVPTFIVFNKGEILKRAVGARSKKQLLEMIETVLSKKQTSLSIRSIKAPKLKDGSIIEKMGE